MKRRVIHYLGMLTVAGLIGAPPALQADQAEPAAPEEHHIYLHVVPPKDGKPVRVTVVPPAEEVAPPAEKKEAVLAEEIEPPEDGTPEDKPTLPLDEESEVDALIDEITPEEEPVDVAEDAEPKDIIAPALEDEEPPILETILEPVTEDLEADTVAVRDDDGEPLIDVEPEPLPEIMAEPPLEEDIEPALVAAPPADAPMLIDEPKRDTPMGLLLFIFVLAIFLGFELISKVPSQLHTPLMSGSNAISGITIVGALAAAGLGVGGAFGTFLGTLAVTFATINVVGGYMVTNRMLAMFKKKDGGPQ